MLANRGLKAVNVGQAVAKNVAEANQDWQPDAAQLQVIDQLLKVDRALRFLGDVRQHVSVGADREITLAPAFNIVQFGRVSGRPGIALSPGGGRPARRAHVSHDTIFAGRYRTNRALVRVTIRPP